MSFFSILKSRLLKFDAGIAPTAPQTSAPAATPQVRPPAPPVQPVKPAPSTPVQPTPADLAAIQSQAREIILGAKDEALKIKDQAVRDAKIQLEEIEIRSKSLRDKQQSLVKQEQDIKRQHDQIAQTEKRITEVKDRLVEQSDQIAKKLEKVATMTKEDAKKELIKQVEKKLEIETARIIKDREEQAKIEADDLAREILVDAMRSGATEYVAEYTVSTVSIPDEETKGRIIGKDGRNIRIFEKVTGVDVSMDEAPDEVRISSFDSVRREIARVTLLRLIKDGRIHPARIEEYHDRAKREVEQIMFQEGQKLCHAVGVYNLPRDLIAILGRFKYRTSYGQNMISHTLEETRIGIKLANELHVNVDTVRLGCLLHDIGKVIDGDGNHIDLGVQLLKKYNMPQPVIDCVAQHHEDEAFSSTESILVYIADAISGSRPGARHENVEEYAKRITQLELIAKKHPEVEEAFAISAGREIRVIVNPTMAGDEQLPILATAIRDEIRDSMTYPGSVKVNIIRETRASEIAH
jgi:ribonucrease Y